MEKIKLASKQDIPALCEIWKKCFDDDEKYIKLFYERNFERIKIYAYFENEKPVSVVHLIDSVLKNKNEAQRAKLVYATGTLPEYRKKGFMSALIRYIADMADKSGWALFLKPSSPATESFYKSLGFKEGAPLRLSVFNPSGNQSFDTRELSPEEYNQMREKAFSSIPHAEWDNPHIKWSIEENEYFSGKTLGIKYENKEHFLLGYPEGKTLIINETDLSISQLREIGDALCESFKTEQIKAYHFDFSCAEGENAFFTLLYNANIDKAYINLIMI